MNPQLDLYPVSYICIPCETATSSAIASTAAVAYQNALNRLPDDTATWGVGLGAYDWSGLDNENILGQGVGLVAQSFTTLTYTPGPDATYGAQVVKARYSIAAASATNYAKIWLSGQLQFGDKVSLGGFTVSFPDNTFGVPYPGNLQTLYSDSPIQNLPFYERFSAFGPVKLVIPPPPAPDLNPSAGDDRETSNYYVYMTAFSFLATYTPGDPADPIYGTNGFPRDALNGET